MNGGYSVEEEEKKKNVNVGGGVEDVYGEDNATEDQFATPWTVSVARLNGFIFLLIVFFEIITNFYDLLS